MGWDWFLLLIKLYFHVLFFLLIVALILLSRSKHSSKYKNHIIIITVFCVCELIGAVLLTGINI